ncbi:MAG: PqqD family protein [Odoribacteraceae bacterium]|jgi:hypothetical protein|nr:PqqD family protein [Odoribacteraceae bacterium]
MKTRCYSINPNISWKLLKDKVVAVNVDNGNYYTFNFTSSLIWQSVDQGKSVAEVEQLLAEQFPEVTSQVIEEDVNEIIDFWMTEKLITEHSEPDLKN